MTVMIMVVAMMATMATMVSMQIILEIMTFRMKIVTMVCSDENGDDTDAGDDDGDSEYGGGYKNLEF